MKSLLLYGSLTWAFRLLVSVALADSVVDPSFSLDPGVRGQVDSICIRPQGKILLGGKFRLADELRYVVVQLDPDGRLDPEFQPLRTSLILDEWQPVDLALPSDGYALLTIGASTHRISPDGRDVRAWGAFGGAPSPREGLRPQVENNSSVTRFLTPLPDGKVMAWGTVYWTSGTGGFSRGILDRMYADGRLDPDFSVAAFQQPDGRLGGVIDFSVARNGDYLVAQDSWNPVLRLSPEGAMLWDDSSLKAIREAFLHSAGFVRETTTGDVLVVGNYNSGIHRLSAQGLPDDQTFDPAWYQRRTKASVLLRDGRLLDSGPFTNIFGLSRPGLVCLAGDGSVDLRFDPGLGVAPTAEVRCMTEDPQGRVLVAGSFTDFDGVPAAGLIRISTRNPGAAPGPTNQFYARLLRIFARECGDPMRVRVTRAGDLEGMHQVPVRAESGTAVAGEDFMPLDTTLVFEPGERFKTIPLKMVADQVPESEENFFVHVGPATPEVGISVGLTLDVSIQSLDCEINFSTNQMQIGEGSLDSSDPSSWLSVRSPFGTVHVKSRDLSAVAGRDYPAWDVRMSSSDGTRSVVALDNPTVDGERSLLLELVDEGEGFLFGSSSNVVVTIRDDDTPLGAARWISGGVDAVHAVPGGRWLLSGAFDRVDGIPRAGLARFGSDGSFDPSFRPPDSLSEASPRVAVGSQGRVLLAGSFPPALDPEGLGVIRLGTEGELDRSYQISSRDQPITQCSGASNLIRTIWMGHDGSLIVSGVLPRFSNCRTPAHVVRFSPEGLRTDSWVLPEEPGESSRIWDDGPGRWIVMGGVNIDQVEAGGAVASIFDIQSHSWARYPLNGVPWAGRTLWVESKSGELMQISPSGNPTPLKIQVHHRGQVLKPMQWSSLLRRSANEVLASATFVPTNGTPQPVVPLLLRLDAAGKVLGFSEVPTTEFTSTPTSLAVGDRGEIAGPSGAWKGGLQWWRFHSDLSPVADLTLEGALPVDSGGAFLRLKGQAPHGYAIEVSDDLQTWRPGSERPEIHWGQTFLERGDNPEGGSQFYRARF